MPPSTKAESRRFTFSPPDIVDPAVRSSTKVDLPEADPSLQEATSCYVANTWTQIALVSSVWTVALFTFVDTCALVNDCQTSPEFSSTACSPFVSNDALAACSLRACASDSRVSLTLMRAAQQMATDDRRVSRSFAMWDSSNASAPRVTKRVEPRRPNVQNHPVLSIGVVPRSIGASSAPSSSLALASTTSTTPALDVNRGDTLLTALRSSMRGSCHIGERIDPQTGVCRAQLSFPSGFVHSIADPSSSSFEGRACGKWQEAARVSCFSCPNVYYALRTSALSELEQWADVVGRMRHQPGSTSNGALLLRRCESTVRESGPQSLVLAARLAHANLIQQRLNPIYTMTNALEAIGMFASYGCNSLVRVGTVATNTRVVVRLANMVPDTPAAVANALFVVDAAPMDRRLGTELMRLLWTGGEVDGVSAMHAPEDDIETTQAIADLFGSVRALACAAASSETAPLSSQLPPPSLEAVSRLTQAVAQRRVTLHVDSLQRLADLTMLSRFMCLLGHDPASSASATAVLDDSARRVATIAVHTIAAMCTVTTASVIAGSTISEASGHAAVPSPLKPSVVIDTLKQRTVPVAIGRVHRATRRKRIETTIHNAHNGTDDGGAEGEPFGQPSEEEGDVAALTTFADLAATSSVFSSTLGTCATTARFAAPAAFDAVAFDTHISPHLMRRVEHLFESVRAGMLKTMGERVVRAFLAEVGRVYDTISTTRMIIPGAPEGSAISHRGDRFRPSLKADDGIILNLLDAARSTKKTLLGALAIGTNPCDSPPLLDANTANAYYHVSGNCIVMYLGLSVPPIISAAFNDEAMFHRYMWITAHELGHASMWSSRTDLVRQHFSEYSSSEREEGIADVLATYAVAAATGTSDACPILLDVAQMFCMSTRPTGALLGMIRFSNSQSSHPSHASRVGKVCKTIQRAWSLGLSNLTCSSTC